MTTLFRYHDMPRNTKHTVHATDGSLNQRKQNRKLKITISVIEPNDLSNFQMFLKTFHKKK